MKKNKSIVFLLGICAWCSAQTISIDVSIYGEYETVKEELQYDTDGMITLYKKTIIPTGEINELITVSKNENGLVVEETSGDKTNVSYITIEENGVKIETQYHKVVSPKSVMSYFMLLMENLFIGMTLKKRKYLTVIVVQ